VAAGHKEISEILVKNGAFVDAIDNDFVTPLILASSFGDLKLLKILIHSGAGLNHTDRMNCTALLHAALRSHSECAIELIKNGGVKSISRPFGFKSFKSPLEYLVINRNYSVAKLLVESGYDLKCEKWIFDNKYYEEDEICTEFINWLIQYLRTPKSLLNQSRIKLRAFLGSQNLMMKIDSLHIPRLMQEYLKMSH
jgi:ankyrin repeat protein